MLVYWCVATLSAIVSIENKRKMPHNCACVPVEKQLVLLMQGHVHVYTTSQCRMYMQPPMDHKHKAVRNVNSASSVLVDSKRSLREHR